jgi:hypothetical protein
MGRMDEMMQMVAICQEYKWTYQEYMSQPSYFIQLVKAKMVRDNKEQELASKKSFRG